MELFRDIVTNVVLLFGLVSIASLTNTRTTDPKPTRQITLGLIIGFITIIVMMSAWELYDGVFFDTRSVLIGVTALFFSAPTAAIATVMAAVYRIVIGGPGVYAGVATLVTACSIGLLWRRFIAPRNNINQYVSFYLFGVTVHVGMLLCQIVFPYPGVIENLRRIAPVVLVVFPLATMLIAMFIRNHERRIAAGERIRASEETYRVTVNNSPLGIIQYDTNGIIRLANRSFANALDIEPEQLIDLDINTLPNRTIVHDMNQSLKGFTTLYEDDYTSYLSGKTFPARVRFAPIRVGNEITGGIGIIEDLSEQRRLEQDVATLRIRDPLTGLWNRAAFDTILLEASDELHYPVTLVVCDINTFQVINTSFGYDVGNEVLVHLAATLLAFQAKHDSVTVYRIGGDEFALVLPGFNEDDARAHVERMKADIAALDTFEFTINLSCGIATATTAEDPIADVYTRALTDMMTNKLYDGSSISTKTIDLIMNTLFEKNPRERAHSERVSRIARLIADQFELGTAFANRTELAARLHDIGKITVASDILDKAGKLTPREWTRIKSHPETGFKILASVPEYLDVATVVLGHHERWDGNGYPRGFAGNKTPLEARIIAVADAFDAMIVARPYRPALSKDAAVAEIRANAATQFDPQVVTHFLAIADAIDTKEPTS